MSQLSCVPFLEILLLEKKSKKKYYCTTVKTTESFNRMTTIFDGYDEEYKSIASSISAKMNEIRAHSDESTSSNNLNHVNDLITQASQLIQQMELEVRSLDASTRQQLSPKLSEYKGHLKDLKAELKKLTRDELFGTSSSSDSSERMKTASETLRGTSDRLSKARQIVADTEDVALEITEELGRNRERIQGTHDKVKNVKSMTQVGRKVIGRMTARDRRQRVFLYAVMIFIVIAMIVICYVGIFGRGRTGSTSTTAEPATNANHPPNTNNTTEVDARSNLRWRL